MFIFSDISFKVIKDPLNDLFISLKLFMLLNIFNGILL